jgi:hypothetical protein
MDFRKAVAVGGIIAKSDTPRVADSDEDLI